PESTATNAVTYTTPWGTIELSRDRSRLRTLFYSSDLELGETVEEAWLNRPRAGSGGWQGRRCLGDHRKLKERCVPPLRMALLGRMFDWPKGRGSIWKTT
ncbi:hypothetical protein, partial [Mesorhizobium sp.]|uniref:hypothetical protein n=1 Tax=Mesorhizobium sp. TaxID=1871066 RepID=UPI00257AE48E